ncbi:hypothetical protein [Nonomuraea sp. NPDC052265]|uniref:hypothetical protein n=1 Tax=Nonomuraea sp. NPDC052265 TaxID=3364374 RepID=UPI0037CCA3CF
MRISRLPLDEQTAAVRAVLETDPVLVRVLGGAKAARCAETWPELTVLPWPS